MLDQITLSSSLLSRVAYQLPYAVELMVARENQESLTGFPSPVVFFFDLMDELAHQVQHAIFCPGLFPKVGSGVTALGRRNGRVAGTAELSQIEGQEIGLKSC